MIATAKPQRTIRTAATIPIAVSLLLHALLLLLVVWLWPKPSPKKAGIVESTRVFLEAPSTLDLGSPVLLPQGDLPADLRGVDVGIVANAKTGETPVPPTQPPQPSQGGGTGVSPVHAGGGGSLFPVPAKANRIVFVVDRSASMGENDKLDLACREVTATLRRLPETAFFQVILYNDSALPLRIDGQSDLLPAEPALLDHVAELLSDVSASGATNHANALRRGLAFHPDVMFFVTDADQLSVEQTQSLTRGNNNGVAIHVIELTRRSGPMDGPLALLARANGGTYRRVALGN